ncbi:MAG TPA: hypothetical protein VNF47_15360 [Streptosporangiaceae bacterium]|nr:hypothetical protein [Streptosporangiaceae bacterium]
MPRRKGQKVRDPPKRKEGKSRHPRTKDEDAQQVKWALILFAGQMIIREMITTLFRATGKGGFF